MLNVQADYNTGTSKINVNSLLSKLDGVKKQGAGYIAKCPAHDDGHASLSVKEGDKAILLHCHAGCDYKRVVDALGVSESDLFFEPPKARTNGTHQSRGRIVAMYDYTDEAGERLYQAVRYDPKHFLQRRPDGAGGWTWKLGNTRRVLYRLPELINGDPDAPVFIPEGEKDVNRLRALGFIATCNVGGAGNWQDEYSPHLTGRDVIILPDNDDPGRAHAKGVARSLTGIARSVKILPLPNLPNKGDVSDWLDAGRTADELRTLAGNAVEWIPAADPEPIEAPAPTLSDIDLDALLTDQGNAEAIIRQYGDVLRFVPSNREFMVFDGKRWSSRGRAYLSNLAVKTAKSYLTKAGEAGTPVDVSIKYAKHGKKSLSAAAINAVIGLCENFEEIHIEAGAFDPDPHLLNVANGTINLRTGDLLPHDKNHLIRSMIPIEYDPDAKCPTWEQSLQQIFNGNDEIVTYIQRYAGYTATGETSDQTFLILYGAGANGKSVMLNALASVLGDYHKATRAETLMIKRGDNIPNDVADLWGARFVSAIETEAGSRMAQSLVKSMSGGDKMKARFLFKNFFEFTPQFKLWLAVNHKPVIDGSDDAMIRRVRLIPFDVKFEKPEENPDTQFIRDDDLPNKWKAEYPGILRWIVDGAICWYKDGLKTPDAVKAATKAYASEMDTLKAFIDDQCVLGRDFNIRAGQLTEAYAAFCSENGEPPIKGRALADRLTRMGFISKHTRNGNFWNGLALIKRNSDDDDV